MIVGKSPFLDTPVWKLGHQDIAVVDQLEILGTIFTSSLSCHAHVEKRCQASKRTMHSLTSIGCCYPGLSTDVRSHLWKTIGLPSMLYSMQTINIQPKNMILLEKLQSGTVKKILGFPVRCHHSHLLNSINVHKPDFYINKKKLGLLASNVSACKLHALFSF